MKFETNPASESSFQFFLSFSVFYLFLFQRTNADVRSVVRVSTILHCVCVLGCVCVCLVISSEQTHIRSDIVKRY